MEQKALKELLEDFRGGRATIEECLARLKSMPFEDLGFAKIDHHRAIRCGFPEVIFCQGKSVQQVRAIAERIVARGSNLLATRASRDVMAALAELFPDAQVNDIAGTIAVVRTPPESPPGTIAVVCAGTSDLPVAEEARVTAEVMGNETVTIYDAGVAGIHRLLAHTAPLQRANVIVVVAGMEGALASVVGGLVDKPVIAVPTSVGYGASFNGLAPLLTMLNSCAAGVSVVNIDNGFGAGYIASLINRVNLPSKEE
ncbi:MAG: nickel pincer cofactor biosynthesis protein LarB [Planctomycetota bacterium]|jgi:NCAIR mutase (PurE)-related protein